MSQASPDQWLVRTADNKITGPMTRDEVVRLIHEGQLGAQDEVCQANRYWFFLHEAREVQTYLGVQLPRFAQTGQGAEEEITETQTEVPVRKRPAMTAPPEANRYPGIPKQQPQRLEQPSVWRGFAWVLVIAAGVVVYSVLKVLR